MIIFRRYRSIGPLLSARNGVLDRSSHQCEMAGQESSCADFCAGKAENRSGRRVPAPYENRRLLLDCCAARVQRRFHAPYENSQQAGTAASPLSS